MGERKGRKDEEVARRLQDAGHVQLLGRFTEPVEDPCGQDIVAGVIKLGCPNTVGAEARDLRRDTVAEFHDGTLEVRRGGEDVDVQRFMAAEDVVVCRECRVGVGHVARGVVRARVWGKETRRRHGAVLPGAVFGARHHCEGIIEARDHGRHHHLRCLARDARLVQPERLAGERGAPSAGEDDRIAADGVKQATRRPPCARAVPAVQAEEHVRLGELFLRGRGCTDLDVEVSQELKQPGRVARGSTGPGLHH